MKQNDHGATGDFLFQVSSKMGITVVQGSHTFWKVQKSWDFFP